MKPDRYAVDARRVAASSIILFGESVVRLAAVAAISFLIARQLGPAQFGILNFASALMAILLGLAEMGMDVPVILRMTASPRPGSLLGTVLTIRATACTLVTLLAMLIAYGLKHSDPLALTCTMIVSLGIIAYIPNAFDYWFKARTSAGAPAMARTCATVLSAAAKGTCLMLGFGVVALSWTVVLEAALTGVGLCLAYRWSAAGSASDELSFERKLFWPLVSESRPYVLSGVAVLLYMKMDVVMLGYLSTNVETGIYGLAQKLSEVIYVVPVVLIASAYPSLTKQYKAGAAGGETAQQLLFDVAVGGSIATVLLAIALVKPVVETIFGSAYRPAVHIFYLHGWSCIAIAMHEARHRWLAAMTLQHYAPIVTGMGLATNVAMNLVLIPRLGATGAAIATLVSYFASGYLSSFVFKPLRQFGALQTRALWPWGRLYRVVRLRYHGVWAT